MPIVEVLMQVHDDVEVFTAFTNRWTPGFQVDQVVADGYRLRRTSDGSVLPTSTGETDLRPEITHQSQDNAF
jgi:hypothetical protein